MKPDESTSTQTTSMQAHGPNRRTFLGLLAGTAAAGLPVLNFGGKALAQAATEAPEKNWVVTHGGPDGPHPPFVSNSRRLLVPPEMQDAPDKWIEHSLQWVDYILRTYPPGLVELPERRPALYRLDEILHIPSAPQKPLVQQFYRMRLQHAIEEIEKTKVTEGMRIWRMYNQGAFVRTPTVSFTFDIVPGTSVPGFTLSSDWLERLAAQSDATFISHRHPDHANKDVARMFLARNKPVLAPEGLWEDDPELSRQLTYPKRIVNEMHQVKIQGGKRELQFVCYPGHQGPNVLNNVNLVVTPETYSVLQTGDQFQAVNGGPGTDSEWLDQIGHFHHVDVVLPDGWAKGLHQIVRGANPQLVIPGHENEMGHPVSHRESYTQDYERLFGLHYPFIVMTWGESYLYTRPRTDIGILPGEN